jgi:hypothetical protein
MRSPCYLALSLSSQLATGPYLSQMNPVHTHLISLTFILVLSSNIGLGFQSSLFQFGFLIKIQYAFLFSSVHATFLGHLILLALITEVIFGKNNKSQSLYFLLLGTNCPPQVTKYVQYMKINIIL